MNMLSDPQAWRQLRDYASGRLSADFANEVLRVALSAERKPSPRATLGNRQVGVSACTVALCVLAAVLIHGQMTRSASLRHLADWQEISVQTASIDPAP